MENENFVIDENDLDDNHYSNILHGVNQLAYPKKYLLGDHNEKSKLNQTKQIVTENYYELTTEDQRSNEMCRLKCAGADESYCHVKLDAILNLKESTKKLLCLLEDIQAKTDSNSFSNKSHYRISDSIRPIPVESDFGSICNKIDAGVIRNLEQQAKELDSIQIQDDEEDCSVYNRLTRKCNCLNHSQYNDFVIHFNENSKYFTSNAGEIIKNLRILKKFVYMGGDYAKHALIFLNEGMTESNHSQRVEITQGCAHADICNVFEDHSIVVACIILPCKYEAYGDTVTQSLAATFIHKLSQLEEGRRYLKFTSKISNEIKKMLRKKAKKLEIDTIDILNEILNLIYPPIAHASIAYFSKPLDEGFGGKIVTALLHSRARMTLDEVFTHLDLLQNMSTKDSGKVELNKSLPAMLYLFKHMLIEYDNSEMNIIVTNILNNVISGSISPELPRTIVMTSTSTEPVKTKIGMSQIPIRKNTKKMMRSKLGLGNAAKYKNLNKSKQRVGWSEPALRSKSEKNGKATSIVDCKLRALAKQCLPEPKMTIIRVPIEEEN